MSKAKYRPYKWSERELVWDRQYQNSTGTSQRRVVRMSHVNGVFYVDGIRADAFLKNINGSTLSSRAV